MNNFMTLKLSLEGWLDEKLWSYDCKGDSEWLRGDSTVLSIKHCLSGSPSITISDRSWHYNTPLTSAGPTNQPQLINQPRLVRTNQQKAN